MTLASNTIDSLSWPSVITVSENIHAAKFDLMKFTPAKKILDDALQSGKLEKGGTVIESSSGTFALALAILCSLYGLKLKLVTGPMSSIVRWRLESLGAQIHVVNASHNCEGGIQQARLLVLHDMLKKHPDAFWPQQYTNPLNSESYKEIGQWLHKKLPNINTIVGSVGSGGSLFGLARCLRLNQPNLKVVAVDHNRSVIFGATAKNITSMCRETFEQILAMGAGIPMGNVEFEQCDVIHWVPVPMMVQHVHRFHKKSGFLIGPSSGAALAVAQWEAENNPTAQVLAILPDHGVRYIDTMFNPGWLSNWSTDMDQSWSTPEQIDSPRMVTPNWCKFDWKRQPFESVLGVAPYLREAGYDPKPL